MKCYCLGNCKKLSLGYRLHKMQFKVGAKQIGLERRWLRSGENSTQEHRTEKKNSPRALFFSPVGQWGIGSWQNGDCAWASLGEKRDREEINCESNEEEMDDSDNYIGSCMHGPPAWPNWEPSQVVKMPYNLFLPTNSQNKSYSRVKYHL